MVGLERPSARCASAISASVPPSPLLSARSRKITYFSVTTNSNAQMMSEPRRRTFDGNAVQGTVFTYGIRERPSQMPTVAAVPHQTALHGAAERGYTSFVTFLVEHGADLQMKDAEGRTALDLAKGIGVAGVRQAQGEGFPETAKAIEALMAQGPSRPVAHGHAKEGATATPGTP